MDIDETRKILGKTAEGLSDDQIRNIIANTNFLVEAWVDKYERSIFNGQTLAEKFPQMNVYKDFDEAVQKSERKNI